MQFSCVCVCAFDTHTHTGLKLQWGKYAANIKSQPWKKNSWASNKRIPAPRWKIGTGEENWSQKDRGNEREHFLPIWRQKITLHVWGGAQVAARLQAKSCLSSSGAEIGRKRTTGRRLDSLQALANQAPPTIYASQNLMFNAAEERKKFNVVETEKKFQLISF